MATVGIVGLGLLGHAIASRLLAGGHQVVGYDVLPDKVGAVVARGGKSAASPAEVARASEMVCTVLPSLATVEEAILGRGGVLEGSRAGHAMVVKLAANLLVALHSAAAAEALTLVKKAGLDPALVLDVLTTSAAASRMLEVRGPLIVKGDFPPQMKLDLFMKDLHLIQDAARSAGAALPLTDVAERLYATVQQAGHAAEDLAVLFKAIETLNGQ